MSAGRLAVSFECTPVRELDTTDHESPTVAIVEAVADLEGKAPTAMPPIAETVDPDVIDRLLGQNGASSELGLCFTYRGWNVFARGDGTVVVGDPEQLSENTPLF